MSLFINNDAYDVMCNVIEKVECSVWRDTKLVVYNRTRRLFMDSIEINVRDIVFDKIKEDDT